MRIKRTGDDCCGPWENIAQQIAAIWTAIYNKVGSVNGKLPVNNGELELTASDVDAYDKDETDGLLAQKQNVLTAGANITIEDDVISATGGGASYEAGSGIAISDENVISNTAPNVQADWNEADSDDPAYIRNKPSIPSVSDRVAFTTGSGAPSGTPGADGLMYFDTTNGYGYEAVNINGTRMWQRIGNAITQVAAIAPTTAPTGLNMIYVDTLNNDIYISQFVYPDSYEWQKVADLTTVDSALDSSSTNPVENSVVALALDDKAGMTVGAADPSTSTVGSVGDFYLNSTSKALFQCTAVTSDGQTPPTYTYTWDAVGGGGSGGEDYGTLIYEDDADTYHSLSFSQSANNWNYQRIELNDLTYDGTKHYNIVMEGYLGYRYYGDGGYVWTYKKAPISPFVNAWLSSYSGHLRVTFQWPTFLKNMSRSIYEGGISYTVYQYFKMKIYVDDGPGGQYPSLYLKNQGFPLVADDSDFGYAGVSMNLKPTVTQLSASAGNTQVNGPQLSVWDNGCTLKINKAAITALGTITVKWNSSYSRVELTWSNPASSFTTVGMFIRNPQVPATTALSDAGEIPITILMGDDLPTMTNGAHLPSV